MTGQNGSPEQRVEGNAPFGMSRYSVRRYSVQHFILVMLVNVLLGVLLACSVWWGNAVLIALTALTLAVSIAKTVLVAWVGLRTIAVEAWIRRLGMGDFEYRIEPRGDDEIAKACRALETLRLRSIEVVRLQLVEKLSADLEATNADLAAKNEALEQAMSQLREAQNQIVAQQKLREMIDLATGVAHEIRNPLNFVSNFCDGSTELLDELMEYLSSDERDDEEIREISNELRANMNHIRRNVGRADRVVAGMINMGVVNGAWQEVALNFLVRQSVQATLDAWVAAVGDKGPKVEVREDPSNPQCLAVPEVLALAIMSLAQNACEAVTLAGKTDSPVIVSVQTDGEEARVTFRDEGCGMTPEVLDKAMTPFFTTKQGDHQGAGLGLCQAADVARSHGGRVTLESSSGQGATATLEVKLRPSMATGEARVD